jgi:hypothetical protein
VPANLGTPGVREQAPSERAELRIVVDDQN